MKHLSFVLLALLLVLCLCACAGDPAFGANNDIFPDGYSLLGIDMSGMEKEEAWDALEAAVRDYTLQLTVDGFPVTLESKDLALTCSREVFLNGVDALETGSEPDFTRLVRYNDGKLRLALNRQLNKPAKEAAIVYDAAAGQYRLESHREGLKTDHSALAVSLREVIRALQPEHTCTGFAEVVYPVWSADTPEAQEVLEKVNKMAASQLTYDFGTADAPVLHQIPSEVIRSLITFGEDGFHPAIDVDAATSYAEELAAIYDTPPGTGPFRTTNGEVLDMVLSYSGCYINAPALGYDISLCAGLGYSGQRAVPYHTGSVRGMPYGGTYVEVDLTKQHLWYYKDGTCMISTDLVSGTVSMNMHTPTGVFSIYSKSVNTVLEGEDYSSFVYYWMPFVGGYGLHDATWRSTFGGDIYLTGGSHGCVNLPLSAARTLYKNAPRGTRVIIYGGEGSQPAREQFLRAQTQHDVTLDTVPFDLDVHSKYAWPDYYYVSDNPEVVTVDGSGIATVTGVGTANITVTCTTESYYASASTVITVNVHPAGETAEE